MSSFTVNTETPISSGTITAGLDFPRYNNWAFEPILHQNFDRLRGRLMDIAECSTRDRQQAKAMQALIKDVLNTAYYESIHAIEDFLRDKGVIQTGEDHEPKGIPLTANSAQDFLVEPRG